MAQFDVYDSPLHLVDSTIAIFVMGELWKFLDRIRRGEGVSWHWCKWQTARIPYLTAILKDMETKVVAPYYEQIPVELMNISESCFNRDAFYDRFGELGPRSSRGPKTRELGLAIDLNLPERLMCCPLVDKCGDWVVCNLEKLCRNTSRTLHTWLRDKP